MVHIKQAADAAVPGYAPPDFTGQLEGQFAAPKEQVVEALKASVENELKTGYAYMVYGNTLRDMSHHSVAEEFAAHASDEAEHADFLLRRLAVLAGAVDLPAIPPPPTLTDPMQIIQTMVRIEQEGIAKWRVLRALVGDEHPMRFKIEEYMTKELEHLDEVVQLLPPQIQLGGSQPPKLASWDRPIDIGVREKAEDDPARLIEGKTFGQLLDAAQRNELGASAPTLDGWKYREGRINESSDKFKKSLRNASLAQAIGDAAFNAPLGVFVGAVPEAFRRAAGKPPPADARVLHVPAFRRAAGKPRGSAKLPMALGGLAGLAIPAVQHALRLREYDKEKDIAAPMADAGDEWHMRRSDDIATPLKMIGYGARDALLASMGSAALAQNHRSPVGAGLVAMGLGGVLSRAAKTLQASNRDILEGRADRHMRREAKKGRGEPEKTAGVPPVFFKRAAEGIPQTGIPLQLSPMASGTLASMAGGNPGGNAPVPATGDDPAQEQEQAALPPTVSPEDIDPEVLLHLQQEQAGQAQEDQAASSYYAQQAEASRQQAQQFEQQLQQQAQQAQQLQQQLQQAQAQLQQTQQMAQSSSEMASQALGTQLQMQQVALQSRQQAVEALQNADGLRQQIRELVDPAPAPMPGANPDPIGQATGQLPQQAPQPQQAQQEAPKTASVLGSVGAIGTDILKDIQMGRGPTQVALPAGAALANAAWNLRDGRPQRDEQAVAAARSRLATAEGDYAQNRSYSNAVKLVAAKGMVASAELAKDHPKAVEATKALGTFTLVRGGSMAANNIAAKVKLMTEAARKGARPNPHA